MRLSHLLSAVLAVLALGPVARAQSNNQCDLPGETPDVIVGDLSGTMRYGTVGGITGYAVGTTSCNVGTCWLNWFSGTPEHPVIGQGMYRLKDGRFEQIGQSWLKHAFTALQGSVCSTSCMSAPDGTHLGVRCSDPYGASLNGQQTRLGPKFEVNAYTGVYPFPATNMSQSGDAIYKRLQVHDVDLDPALNPGALYFVEGQYVSHDDATSGNGANNCSYRPTSVSAAGGVFNITLTGSTVRQRAGIQAWRTTDPSVTETTVTAPGDGVFIVSAKATSLGGGIYHYEYAVQNINSDRSGGTFSVPIPPGALVTNIGFHDVDYHSGEPFDGTDWTGFVGPTYVGWKTSSFDSNPNANALRWGTLYNFRFDANVPPATNSVTIGLFKPAGFIGSVSASTVTPMLCNNNGVCDAGENCANCASDCFHQGGGTGCCGNTVCDPGENPCRCAVDCGAQQATETSCGNGADDDCDGLIDCLDRDCCSTAACASHDHDGDQFAFECDCNDSDASVFPGAPQLCDGINNDCSDPGWPATPAAERDLDGDGVRPCAGDCDDSDSRRFPGNPEVCDGVDNDCSGSLPANEADADSDSHRLCSGDCDDASAAVWSTPGEAIGVTLTRDHDTGATEIGWGAPPDMGGTSVLYDTLRSPLPADFVSAAVCLETSGADTTTLDPVIPSAGSAAFYLVRAKNACPSGEGPLGMDSNAIIRIGRSCP